MKDHRAPAQRSRRRLPSRRLALTLALAAGWGCADPTPPGRGQEGDRPRSVVVISVDGLRPDAITAATPNLRRMMEQGAYSPSARTTLPSRTLPSHASMLTGVPPEVHGVTWNDEAGGEGRELAVPTVFELARGHGYRSAAFAAKPKLRQLLPEESLDHLGVPDAGPLPAAREVARQVVDYLEANRPDLVFVHLADPDQAGHASGWMSEPYLRAVARADSAVGEIWQAARRRYGSGLAVLVTADHGGRGYGHGSDTPEEVTIPWIAWGGPARGALRQPVTTFDTAATVLWLLAIEPPAGWAGRPVPAAFAR